MRQDSSGGGEGAGRGKELQEGFVRPGRCGVLSCKMYFCAVSVYVCVFVKGYSVEHTYNHQISLHSGIPVLPRCEKTTTYSINAGMQVCLGI